MIKEESHNVEFKLIWKDDYLKQLCGFANTQGGSMYLGVNDAGQVIGLDRTKRLLEDLPNKVMNTMGIVPQVILLTEQNKPYIIITIAHSNQPISLQGKFYKRVGTTTQELNGTVLQNFLLSQNSSSWDEYIIEGSGMHDVDQEMVHRFVEFSIAANRLPAEAKKMSMNGLFEQLHLIDKNKQLNRAAMLAFGLEPTKYFSSMGVKMGRFLSDTHIVVQDVFEQNLFRMVESIMDVLKTKYLQSIIFYKGIHREEQLELPEIALREALLNALIHRDYSGAMTQIRVNNKTLTVWNAGLLPEALNLNMLLEQHPSWPRNRCLANLFFKAGYIESWGRGTLAMVEACKTYGLSKPKYTENAGGFAVEFFKDAQVTPQVTPQDTPQVTPQVAQLLEIINGEMTRDDLQKALKVKDREYFRLSFIKPALAAGLIEMTLPDKPNSKNQKYRKATHTF
ncbi:MAG: putative DNA binding domain-containing protein [Salinivirgaceae bacterium]|nr:putative DNA binding domain-containing protein [Salinivirgaceae bacterium]